LVKPGAAYRERPTAYKIPSYKEIDRNLIVAFVRESSPFLGDPDKPGRVTTAEVYAEDKQIIKTIQAGKGAYEPIGRGKEWTMQSARVAGDLTSKPPGCYLGARRLTPRLFDAFVRNYPPHGLVSSLKPTATYTRVV
jgi:hypothetical protein